MQTWAGQKLETSYCAKRGGPGRKPDISFVKRFLGVNELYKDAAAQGGDVTRPHDRQCNFGLPGREVSYTVIGVSP